MKKRYLLIPGQSIAEGILSIRSSPFLLFFFPFLCLEHNNSINPRKYSLLLNRCLPIYLKCFLLELLSHLLHISKLNRSMVNRRQLCKPQLKWKPPPPRIPLTPKAKSRGFLFLWPKGLSGQATKKSLWIHFLVWEYCTSYLLTYNIAEGCWNKCPRLWHC